MKQNPCGRCFFISGFRERAIIPSSEFVFLVPRALPMPHKHESILRPCQRFEPTIALFKMKHDGIDMIAVFNLHSPPLCVPFFAPVISFRRRVVCIFTCAVRTFFFVPSLVMLIFLVGSERIFGRHHNCCVSGVHGGQFIQIL